MISISSLLSPFSNFSHLKVYEVTHTERYDGKYHFLSLTPCLIQEALTL